MEYYATDLKLSFVFCSFFFIWSNLVSFYLLPCTTTPTCQPEAVCLGMAIRVGSGRREIQWGLEYRMSLVFGWSIVVRFKTQPFKNRTFAQDCRFFKKKKKNFFIKRSRLTAIRNPNKMAAILFSFC